MKTIKTAKQRVRGKANLTVSFPDGSTIYATFGDKGEYAGYVMTELGLRPMSQSECSNVLRDLQSRRGTEPPCHSRPKNQWCDSKGPGGFLGHTCMVRSEPKS